MKAQRETLTIERNGKPRVLLLSASSGAGHVRAAQALEKAFAAHGSCLVEHVDAIEYVSKLFQRVYDKAYISMVRRAPEFMGVLYERTDQPWRHLRRRAAPCRATPPLAGGGHCRKIGEDAAPA